MEGKAVTWRVFWGRGTRAGGWSGVWGTSVVLLVNDNILYHVLAD